MVVIRSASLACQETGIPVLGHMFVGLATGMVTRPPDPVQPKPASRVVIRELWDFIAVFLAFSPDIFAQALHFAGWNTAGLFFHSLLFAVMFPTLIALAFRVSGFAHRRIFFVALISIIIHDALDLGQATDKVPFWPFSDHVIALRAFQIPSGMVYESCLFGGLFLLFLLVRRFLQHPEVSGRMPETSPTHLERRTSTANKILLASVVLMAIVTNVLRDTRERQLASSRALVEGGRYEEGLKLLEASEQWPSAAKPGRTDYLRGAAFLGVGDRVKAEEYFLKSFKADPTYLWVVIDLASFYAEAPLPLTLRVRLAAPYLELLRRDFHDRKEASDASARIDAIFSRGERRSR